MSKNNEYSTNAIPDINADWGNDTTNNLPYSKAAVQTFIKSQMGSLQNGISTVDTKTDAKFGNWGTISSIAKFNTKLSNLEVADLVTNGAVCTKFVGNISMGGMPVPFELSVSIAGTYLYFYVKTHAALSTMNGGAVSYGTADTGFYKCSRLAKGDTLSWTSAFRDEIAQGLGDAEDKAISQKAAKLSITELDNKITALTLGAKAVLTTSPSYIYLNTSTSVTVTATFSSSGGLIADTIVVDAKDGSLVMANKTNTTSVMCLDSPTLTSASGVATMSYRTTMSYKGATFTASASVNARYPILYGFASSCASASKKLSARGSAVETYEDTCSSAAAQKFYICVPIGIGELSGFTMGGAPATFKTMYKSTINSIEYKIYESVNEYQNGTKLTIKAS